MVGVVTLVVKYIVFDIIVALDTNGLTIAILIFSVFVIIDTSLTIVPPSMSPPISAIGATLEGLGLP